MGGATYYDEIVIFRVITSRPDEARRYLSDMKERLKRELAQEEILIVERKIETL